MCHPNLSDCSQTTYQKRPHCKVNKDDKSFDNCKPIESAEENKENVNAPNKTDRLENFKYVTKDSAMWINRIDDQSDSSKLEKHNVQNDDEKSINDKFDLEASTLRNGENKRGIAPIAPIQLVSVTDDKIENHITRILSDFQMINEIDETVLLPNQPDQLDIDENKCNKNITNNEIEIDNYVIENTEEKTICNKTNPFYATHPDENKKVNVKNEFKENMDIYDLVDHYKKSKSKNKKVEHVLENKTSKLTAFDKTNPRDAISSGDKKDNKQISELFDDLFHHSNFKVKQSCIVFTAGNTMKHSALVRGIPWPRFSQDVYRLSTYTNYPTNAVKSAALLAADGFIYIGNGSDDKVVCFFCGGMKENWKPEDVIEIVHRLMSPECPQAAQSRQTTEGGASFYPPSHDSDNTSDSSQLAIPAYLEGNTLNDPTIHFETGIEFHSSAESTSNGNEYSSEQETANVQATDYNDAAVNEPNLQHNSYSAQDDMLDPPSDPIGSSLAGNVNNDDNPVTVAPTSNSYTETSRNNMMGERNPTFFELGIITNRPKRPEYAVSFKRLESFASWPRSHHLTPEELVEAGFYFAGYGDCARCFFCGGGLRNWEDYDNPWIEHARWFPRCSYLRQKVGQDFVDAVQHLHVQQDQISRADITQIIQTYGSRFTIDNEDRPLKRDPAVISVLRLGFSEKDVLELASILKLDDNMLSSDDLINKLVTEGRRRAQTRLVPLTSENLGRKIEEEFQSLKDRNSQIRQQILCKICLNCDVSVVFLPCGHLVSCGDCASAMRNCPLCRTNVRGVVRVVLS